MEMNEWLYLSIVPGIGLKKQKAILDYCGNEKRILTLEEKELDAIPLLNQKDKEMLLLYRRNSKFYNNAIEKMKQYGVSFIGKGEKGFPQKLLLCPDPPVGLFYRGRLPRQEQKTIAIVGARACSRYGEHYAKKISEALVDSGAQVISGLARGIDGYATEAAVERKGRAFAVLAGGVEMIYPPEHYNLYHKTIAYGGAISEYPVGIKPAKGMFPRRNRIISGLADAVIIIEAREKSGSFITADYALEQGRDIYVLPGRVDDPLSAGCNRYIREGAGIITSIKELLLDLGLKGIETGAPDKKEKIILEKQESLVYAFLSLVPKGLDEIIAESGMDVKSVIDTLFKLVEMGLAEECYKNQFVRRR
ncbi:MAG: DNA-processing protein DprA [Lachnospiraceae bacterium]|nr:DNA-processing protein DprA [Lachnospiraceae bacterium]